MLKTIFLATLALPFLCIAIYAQTDLSFEVPAPPGGSLVETHPMTMGGRKVETFLYKTAVEQDKIREFYEHFFEAKDFEVILDRRDKKQNEKFLRFKREDLVVNIAFLDNGQIVIAKYLQPKGSPDIEKMPLSVKDFAANLPTQDVEGKDLEDVPRPPSSVRFTNTEIGTRSLLVYRSSLTVEDIRGFYQSEMARLGWQLEGDFAVNKAVEAYKNNTRRKDLGIRTPFSDGEDLADIVSGAYLLNFKGSDAKVMITVFPDFVDKKSGTVVNIDYSKEGS